MTTSTAWSEYLRRILPGRTNAEIAKALNLHDATVGRWMNGVTERPAAEAVIVMARKLQQDPVRALVAVGYLSAEEAAGHEMPREFGLDDYELIELMREALRRMERGEEASSSVDVGGPREDFALAASDDADWQERQERENE